jgi:hypothetical protein
MFKACTGNQLKVIFATLKLKTDFDYNVAIARINKCRRKTYPSSFSQSCTKLRSLLRKDAAGKPSCF